MSYSFLYNFHLDVQSDFRDDSDSPFIRANLSLDLVDDADESQTFEFQRCVSKDQTFLADLTNLLIKISNSSNSSIYLNIELVDIFDDEDYAFPCLVTVGEVEDGRRVEDSLISFGTSRMIVS